MPPEKAATEAQIESPGPTRVHDRPGKGRAGALFLSEVGLALVCAGVVLALFLAYQLLGTNLTEQATQHSLARQFQAELVPFSQHKAPAAPSSSPSLLPAPPVGSAIAHLVIPAINVDKYVVEGTDEADLRRGPGHYIGTAYPGQVGNVGIAGHRTTFGAPFFELNRLKAGDVIELTDLRDRTWIYKVTGAPVVVAPTDVAVLDPTPYASLTLTTCNPRFLATSRLVVFARLVGQALPPQSSSSEANRPAATPAGRPTQLASGRGPSHDPGAVSAAILYGGFALALWILTRVLAARSRRWRKVATITLGAALCLVPLWFAFENAVLVLPQSI